MSVSKCQEFGSVVKDLLLTNALANLIHAVSHAVDEAAGIVTRACDVALHCSVDPVVCFGAFGDFWCLGCYLLYG